MSPNGGHKRKSDDDKQQGMSVTNLVAWIAFLLTVVTVVHIIWGG